MQGKGIIDNGDEAAMNSPKQGWNVSGLTGHNLLPQKPAILKQVTVGKRSKFRKRLDNKG